MLETAFSRGRDTVPTILFMEVLGVFLAYAAVFGDLAHSGWRALRVLLRLVLLAAGICFVVVSLIELSHNGKTLAIGVLALVATAGPLGFRQLTRWRTFRDWRSWPLVQGHIEETSVREIRTRYSHYWFVELAYSYAVGNEYYSGRSTEDFTREEDASEYAAAMQGGKVFVRYDPKCLERSKLDLSSGALGSN